MLTPQPLVSCKPWGRHRLSQTQTEGFLMNPATSPFLARLRFITYFELPVQLQLSIRYNFDMRNYQQTHYFIRGVPDERQLARPCTMSRECVSSTITWTYKEGRVHDHDLRLECPSVSPVSISISVSATWISKEPTTKRKHRFPSALVVLLRVLPTSLNVFVSSKLIYPQFFLGALRFCSLRKRE